MGGAGRQAAELGRREAGGGGVSVPSGGAQSEVMSLSALSSSSLMALYFIFCAYTSSAGSGEGAAGGWRAVERGGGEWQRERERVSGARGVRVRHWAQAEWMRPYSPPTDPQKNPQHPSLPRYPPPCTGTRLAHGVLWPQPG